MIAEKVYTLLKQLITLGSDADWNGSGYTASLIVERLSIIGINN